MSIEIESSGSSHIIRAASISDTIFTSDVFGESPSAFDIWNDDLDATRNRPPDSGDFEDGFSSCMTETSRHRAVHEHELKSQSQKRNPAIEKRIDDRVKPTPPERRRHPRRTRSMKEEKGGNDSIPVNDIKEKSRRNETNQRPRSLLKQESIRRMRTRDIIERSRTETEDSGKSNVAEGDSKKSHPRSRSLSRQRSRRNLRGRILHNFQEKESNICNSLSNEANECKEKSEKDDTDGSSRTRRRRPRRTKSDELVDLNIGSSDHTRKKRGASIKRSASLKRASRKRPEKMRSISPSQYNNEKEMGAILGNEANGRVGVVQADKQATGEENMQINARPSSSPNRGRLGQTRSFDRRRNDRRGGLVKSASFHIRGSVGPRMGGLDRGSSRRKLLGDSNLNEENVKDRGMLSVASEHRRSRRQLNIPESGRDVESGGTVTASKYVTSLRDSGDSQHRRRGNSQHRRIRDKRGSRPAMTRSVSYKISRS